LIKHLSAFFCIFDQSILKTIKVFTNAEAARRCSGFSVNESDVLSFIAVLFARGHDEPRLYFMISENLKLMLCFISGVLCQKMSVKMMWSNLYGIQLVRLLMSRNKFLEILQLLGFKNDRKSKIGRDKFLLVRELWYKLINNSLSSCKPTKYLTVDEQLFPCKS
jgi:hypothetical protein